MRKRNNNPTEEFQYNDIMGLPVSTERLLLIKQFKTVRRWTHSDKQEQTN